MRRVRADFGCPTGLRFPVGWRTLLSDRLRHDRQLELLSATGLIFLLLCLGELPGPCGFLLHRALPPGRARLTERRPDLRLSRHLLSGLTLWRGRKWHGSFSSASRREIPGRRGRVEACWGLCLPRREKTTARHQATRCERTIPVAGTAGARQGRGRVRPAPWSYRERCRIRGFVHSQRRFVLGEACLRRSRQDGPAVPARREARRRRRSSERRCRRTCSSTQFVSSSPGGFGCERDRTCRFAVQARTDQLGIDFEFSEQVRMRRSPILEIFKKL